MPPFRYPPLSPSTSIRLLLLKPSFSRNTPLECCLRTFPLSARPRYEALSYTWDDQIPSRPLLCNGDTLLMTPNVEAALERLRGRFLRRILWIDAICIDQSSFSERSHQVSLMDDIFRDANRVIVWLGEGDKATAQAIRDLKWLFPLYKLGLHFFLTRNVALRALNRAKENFQAALLHQNQANANEPKTNLFRGFHRIIHHNWFRRIWTFQEVALATKAVVRFGSSKIQWSILSTALTFDRVLLKPRLSIPVLIDGGYNPSVPIYDHIPFIIRIHQAQILQEWMRIAQNKGAWTVKYAGPRPPHTPLPFVLNFLLMGLNSEYMATDSNDRIFGLLGALRILGVELPPPDYEKKLSALLLDTYTAIVREKTSLELLNFVTGERFLDELPSWIPNFSWVPWSSINNGDGEPSDSEGLLLEHDAQIDGRQLSLTGIVLDTIHLTTEALGRRNGCADGKSPLGLPSTDFVSDINKWIHFARKMTGTKNFSEHEQVLLLFKLLLHSQVSRFYEDAMYPYYISRSLGWENSLSSNRLLGHFTKWLHSLDSGNPVLTTADDRIFDQVQHFISSELIITRTTGRSFPVDDTTGYSRALLVIQRWVREFTVRKRLFSTKNGHVGIGWEAMKPDDQVVRFAGLQSLLLVRRLGHNGSTDFYQLIGPCIIPHLAGQKLKGTNGVNVRRFTIV